MAGSKNRSDRSKKSEQKEAGKVKNRDKSSTSAKKRKHKSPLRTNDQKESLNTSNNSVWTCKVCKEDFNDVNDRLIVCERCNEPECFSCSHLETEAEYETLSRSKRLHYYCVHCEEPAIMAVQNDNLIEENCKKYFDKLHSEFSLEVKELKQKVDSLENKLTPDNIKELIKVVLVETKDEKDTDSKTKTEPEKKDLVSDSIQEMKERDRRRINILLFNVEESKDDSIDNRKAQDSKKVEELLSELGVPNVKFRNPVRLPKSKDKRFADKPKPLRITLENEITKVDILQRLKNMDETKKVKLKGIYMKKDMTPMERSLLRAKKANVHVQNPPPQVEGETK